MGDGVSVNVLLLSITITINYYYYLVSGVPLHLSSELYYAIRKRSSCSLLVGRNNGTWWCTGTPGACTVMIM
jgi:hypothetical protein